MHGYICEPTDAATLAAFRQALQSLVTERLRDVDSSLGVRFVEFRIGEETLRVFNDDWSVDIEGSEELVRKVLNAVAEARR